RHTRFSRDWSSDVCSSDLRLRARAVGRLDRLAEDGRDPVEALLDPRLTGTLLEGLGVLERDRDEVRECVEQPEVGPIEPVRLPRSEERRVGTECGAGLPPG